MRLEDVFLEKKKPQQSMETDFWIQNFLKKKKKEKRKKQAKNGYPSI